MHGRLIFFILFASIIHGSTITVTQTLTATETVNLTYRAGLILINSMTISGTDAYAKEFVVDNVAEVTFANAALNVFAIPSTATCAYISTVIIDLPEINTDYLTESETWVDEKAAPMTTMI
jgi:hypothetical protein